MNYLSLLLVVLLAVFLRLNNISPFKFYPDAYQSLVVAKNITEYHSVLGTLGPNGVLYPYFFIWSRSGYPILIDLFNFIFHNLEKSAYVVSIGASVLAVLVVYFYLFNVFKSRLAGTLGSLLLALSFNHTVWSGFIYTESLGILFLLLTLWSLFNNIEKKSNWFNWKDLLTGFFLFWAVFTRYEYLVLIIPILLLIYLKNQTHYKKSLNILVSLTFFSSLMLFSFYPLNNLSGIVFAELSKFIFILGGILLGGIILVLLKPLVEKYLNDWRFGLARFITGLVFLLSVFLLLQYFYPDKMPFLFELSGLRNFLINEPLIWAAALFGIYQILIDKKNLLVGYFALFSMVLLYPVYYQINPSMQRYITHLLPFMLILAGFGGWHILSFIRNNNLQKIGGLVLITLTLFQLQLTLNGIKNWNSGRWFKVSYEETSAKKLTTKDLDKNAILISALPEAYYFYTGLSTQSILETDQAPFLELPDSLNNQEVLIVHDLGMVDLFPNFSRFVDQNLTDKKFDQYWVGEEYNFSIKSKKDDRPVSIYKISLTELKTRIVEVQKKETTQ